MNPQTLTDEQVSLVMSSFHEGLSKANMKEPGFALKALREALMIIADEGHGTPTDRALWDALGGTAAINSAEGVTTLGMAKQVIEQRDALIKDNSETIEAIKRAATLNGCMQNKHAKASSEWHSHETIDDHLFRALELLGD